MTIDRFLNIAQILKIDGLLSSGEDNDDQYLSNKSETKQEQTQTYIKSNDDKYDEDSSVNFKAISLNDSSSVDEIEQKVTEHLRKNENGDYTCNLCGKTGGKNIRNMKNHIETHMEGISFSCSICGKQFRSRNSMNNHKTVFHRNK